uniref:Uncharacterized protein n=1 Tax=Arundo donax TaxID=35708 RepID=A0A0A9B2S3_ARUDO
MTDQLWDSQRPGRWYKATLRYCELRVSAGQVGFRCPTLLTAGIATRCLRTRAQPNAAAGDAASRWWPGRAPGAPVDELRLLPPRRRLSAVSLSRPLSSSVNTELLRMLNLSEADGRVIELESPPWRSCSAGCLHA